MIVAYAQDINPRLTYDDHIEYATKVVSKTIVKLSSTLLR